MRCGLERIGWVIGESTPSRSTILFDRDAGVRAGIYVVASNGEDCVLGVVEKVVSGNPLLPEGVNDSEEIEGLASYEEISGRLYRRGVVRWFSLVSPLIEEGKVESPRAPVDPSSEVYTAPSETLKRVFSGDGASWVRIGSLLSDPSVEAGIDVNRLSRHLAILAVTGGGKSNTVCILANRIVGELGGTLILFDVHGEYAQAEIAPGNQKIIEPRIHPASLSFAELHRLTRMPSGATNQERILREAWKRTIDAYRRGEIPKGDFMKTLISNVEKLKGIDKGAAQGALNRLDDVLDYYGEVLSEDTHTDLTLIIEPGKLNVFNLSGIDEQGADAVVSHYLRRILAERKLFKASGGSRGYPVPVLVVIEEAHVLIPKDEASLTKTWASRIAREGRKFGVGLVLVSQRPKGLDPNVLSQTNNKIILRIVEPTDQRYVQQASEQLSEDLLSLLPDLNPGEAVVLGSMVKIPALVKIDKCSADTGGGDIDLASEWSKWRNKTSSVRERLQQALYSTLD